MTTATTTEDTATNHSKTLRDRLESRTAAVAIIGLGYVGLPLARAVHDAGYRVIGYDTDPRKIDALSAGENYLKHLGADMTRELAASDRFHATADSEALADADVIILCVPTPLGPHHEPDLSYVLNSTKLAAQTLRPGQLVILESTTYPDTTRGEMQPILEQTGLTCGSDFFLAYSPEREDPGRAGVTTRSIPKLVGGVDDVSTDLAMALYSNVVENAHRVSSAEVAEAAKLLENIYRAVNIALVNELKVILTEMGIDIWEVIDAASTKPFGFQPFYPGPGLGGHCIPIDPFYLAWKAKAIGRATKFIELAGEINHQMPEYVVWRTTSALNEHARLALNGSKILVIGLAYKPNIDDIRESPAAEIIEMLQGRGAEVSYHDPHVPRVSGMRHYPGLVVESVELTDKVVHESDCVLIVTNHDAVDYEMIGAHAKLIVDTRNAMKDVPASAATVVKS